jgi:stringent starvation protein A
MAVAANKRSTMTLYADPHDLSSHRVRIVLAEKGVAVDIIDVDKDNLPEDFKRINPYQTLPTLIDRDLALYEPSIIVIEIDWYRLVRQIEKGDDATAKSARKILQESLLGVLPIFSATPYFLSEEFSLVDCGMAPLLWRLSKLGITLPPQAKAIKEYAERLFERSSFKSSLTQVEREFDDIK